MAEKRSKVFWALFGTLSAAGGFVIWRLTSLSRPVEPPPAKVEEADAPPVKVYDGPTYDVPEELNKDHERAFKYAEKTSGPARAELADYYACRALQKESPEPCKEVDVWATGLQQSPPCQVRYYGARLLRAAFSGDNKPLLDACLDYVKVNSPDIREADRKACGLVVPMLREGRDNTAVCQALVEAGVFGAKFIPRCEKETLYLKGDPSACAVLSQGGEKQTCEKVALFIKAMREKKPELLKDSPYYALTGEPVKGDPCKPVAKLVVDNYLGEAKAVFQDRADSEMKAWQLQHQERERARKAARLEAEQAARLAAEKRQEEEKARAFELAKIKAAEEERKIAEAREKMLEEWTAREEKARAERLAKKEIEEKTKFEAARRADEARRRKLGLPMEDSVAGRRRKAKKRAAAKAEEESGADAVMISSEREE